MKCTDIERQAVPPTVPGCEHLLMDDNDKMYINKFTGIDIKIWEK